MKPLFSIVLPTYNHAHLIGSAITSIIDQTYTNWELIIIDNNSIDNTSEVISKFDNRKIKTFKINNNGVIACSRNMGIIKSIGQWIAFIDSDDIWYPDKLSVVVDYINSKKDCHVFCHDEIMLNTKTKRTKNLQYGPYVDEFYSNMLIGGNKLSTSSTVVLKKYIESNNLLFRENKNLVTVEDYDFWLLLARSNAKFYFIKKSLGEYRIHGLNMSIVNINFFKNLIFLIKDHVFNLQDFEKKKYKLFSIIYLRVVISKSLSLFRNRNYRGFLNQIFFLFKILPKAYLSILFNNKNNFN
tara:strand:- start:156 stop:1049 length:894 start_codon:yes stop_codon:yes gene_type:complete